MGGSWWCFRPKSSRKSASVAAATATSLSSSSSSSSSTFSSTTVKEERMGSADGSASSLVSAGSVTTQASEKAAVRKVTSVEDLDYGLQRLWARWSDEDLAAAGRPGGHEFLYIGNRYPERHPKPCILQR